MLVVCVRVILVHASFVGSGCLGDYLLELPLTVDRGVDLLGHMSLF